MLLIPTLSGAEAGEFCEFGAKLVYREVSGQARATRGDHPEMPPPLSHMDLCELAWSEELVPRQSGLQRGTISQKTKMFVL